MSSLHIAVSERVGQLLQMLEADDSVKVDGCLVLGVMSGTSLDGVDLCLARLAGSGFGGATSLRIAAVEAFTTNEMPSELLISIRKCITQSGTTADLAAEICRLNTSWSRVVGTMCNELIESWNPGCHESIVIASHGQTIWHESGNSTLQLGDGEVLAQVTGRVVVSNFRAADVAVGGTGAPLVPYFDRVLAASMRRCGSKLQYPVALQNLGGIGNVCWMETEQLTSRTIAFDTGPANVVLNELVAAASAFFTAEAIEAALSGRIHGEAKRAAARFYDVDGVYSTQGNVDADLLHRWLEHPFFKRSPPKSTGREDFGTAFVREELRRAGMMQEGSAEDRTALPPRFFDLCRTAAELCAASIAQSFAAFLPAPPRSLLLCGGGAHHPIIVSSLKIRLGESVNVAVLDEIDLVGVTATPPNFSIADAKEALAFAVLGHEKMMSLAVPYANESLKKRSSSPNLFTHPVTNVTCVTGASRGVSLGQISVPI